MYYVYFLRATSKNSTYIGYTSDLERRLKEHTDKGPELVYYEAYKSEKDARNREKMLKQRGQAIRWLKSRLENSLAE
ncbi:MAG: GIY-YIG nuclease family protein [Patescibacteria group bacterium]